MSSKWSEIIQDGGVFVSTKISMYRATRRWKMHELGMISIPKNLGNAGSINLLPKEICPEYEELKRIEGAVNNLVAMNTFEFEGIGRFLKISNFKEFSAQVDELKHEYENHVDKFINNFHLYIEKSVEMWRGFADRFGISEDEMEEYVRNAFPRGGVRGKFKISVQYYKLPSPAIDVWEGALEEQQKLAEEFISATQTQLREEAYSVMMQIEESVNSGKWNQKTLNRVGKMLNRIKAMQIVEDELLVDEIEKFKAEHLSVQAQEYKSDDELLGSLKKGLSSITESLDSLSCESSNITGLELDTGRKINI